jgi:hypothetical protein
MEDAFSLARSGLDALKDIEKFYAQADQSNPTPTQQAQIDLLRYLFADARASDTNDLIFQQLLTTFRLILSFRPAGNGGPLPRPDKGIPPGDGVIIYCDYSRFLENRDCDGEFVENKACDTDLMQVIDMTDAYLGCKHSLNTDKTEVSQRRNHGG